MGSEHLFVESVFRRSGSGLAVRNYNALSDVALSSTFDSLGYALDQNGAGSVHAYNSTMRGISRGGVRLQNSANDTFLFDHISYLEPTAPLITQDNSTAAPINVLVENSTLSPAPAGAANSQAALYLAGGSLVFTNTDLGGRIIRAGGSIGYKAIVLDARSQGTSQLVLDELARGFFLAPSP
jgi:hypothetical protein